MPSTTNFGWTTPADTDLVKDGASAIRTLGNGIDTSFVDLKGGTTGQVLSKNSNTDLDFTWVAQDDSNAIQNALLTTTGDTIYASSASTPARLGIGSAGQVLTVSGGVPTWATPASGSLTLISTTTLSGTAVNLTSIPSTYRSLYLVVRNFLPQHNNSPFLIRFNTDGANRYNYDTSTSAINTTFGSAFGRIAGSQSNTTANNIVTVFIPDYANTATWKISIADCLMNNGTTATNFNYQRTITAYNQTGAISAVNLSVENVSTGGWASGSFTSGTVLLYGVN